MEFEYMKGYIPGYREWKKAADKLAADEQRRVDQVRHWTYLRRIDAVRNKDLDEMMQVCYE